jgi:hypothetical protein
MTTTLTKLDPHTRGDTFVYSFTLGNGWTASMFTGGIKWTLREQFPASSVTDDADAIAQASVAGGEIVFSDTTHGTITIADSLTDSWLTKTLSWDLQGVVTGPPRRTYTIDRGTILILGDASRSH